MRAVLALLSLSLLACKGSPSGRSDEPPQPVVEVAVADLLNDYRGNEVRGDVKYKGRRVRITGVVGQVKKDILDSMYVTIGTGAVLEIPTVQCFLRDDQVQRAASLNRGQPVTVDGRVDGLLMNVLAKDCEIVRGALTPTEVSEDKICTHLRSALAEGRCDEKRRIELVREGSLWLRGGGMCLSSAAEYAGAKDGALGRIKQDLGALTLTTFESRNPLCFGFFVSGSPLPSEMKSKIQDVFDAL